MVSQPVKHFQQDAVRDGRRRPRCCHLVISIKQRCLTYDWCRRLANWTKYTCRLWFGPTSSFIWKHDVIHRTGSTQHISLASEEDRATSTGNLYRKCCDICMCGFSDMWVDRQKDKQAHRQTEIQTRYQNTLNPYEGGREVTIQNVLFWRSRLVWSMLCCKLRSLQKKAGQTNTENSNIAVNNITLTYVLELFAFSIEFFHLSRKISFGFSQL